MQRRISAMEGSSEPNEKEKCFHATVVTFVYKIIARNCEMIESTLFTDSKSSLGLAQEQCHTHLVPEDLPNA